MKNKEMEFTRSEPNDSAEFWRKRAKYYSGLCFDLIAEMGKGVKLDSVIINENGITFTKRPGCEKVRSGGDTIDRHAAIDAVISICDDCDSGYCGSCRVNYPGEKDARKALEDLPSAQPGIKEMAVDIGYLRDWYQSSVLDDAWPDRYIEEIYHDFYLIPKQDGERDE